MLAAVGTWGVNPVETFANKAALETVAQERAQVRHRVLQSLAGDLGGLHREVALDVGDAQGVDRVRRFRSAGQKLDHRRPVMSGRRPSEPPYFMQKLGVLLDQTLVRPAHRLASNRPRESRKRWYARRVAR